MVIHKLLPRKRSVNQKKHSDDVKTTNGFACLVIHEPLLYKRPKKKHSGDAKTKTNDLLAWLFSKYYPEKETQTEKSTLTT